MPDSLNKSKENLVNSFNQQNNSNMPSTSASSVVQQISGGIERNSPLSLTDSIKNVAVDTLFEPSVDMMVNDFDDERTLEEEEALAAIESEDPNTELSNLKRESDMPIEELLALYNCSGSASLPSTGIASSSTVKKSTRSRSNSTNENESEEQNCEDEEPSELIKLYTEQFTQGGGSGSRGGGSGSGIVGSGTGTEDQRLLRALSRPPSEDEDDGEYSPDEDDVKKTIMVGSEFQAIIPEGLLRYDDALPYENEDKLLWDPLKLTEPEIENYLLAATIPTGGMSPPYTISGETPHTPSITVASSTQNPSAAGRSKLHRDDEQALYLLLQCGHNVEEALRRRRITNSLTATASKSASTDNMSLWSEEECRNFENGLRSFGKDFHTIRESKVRTRSVGELVQFYYLWKKTERHDVFANKARLEKKKYSLHPGVTDYMDRFLEEQENGNSGSGINSGTSGNSNQSVSNNQHPTSLYRDRSSSPGINSLLYADTKHHHSHTSIHYNGSKHNHNLGQRNIGNHNSNNSSSSTTAVPISAATMVTVAQQTNTAADPLAISDGEVFSEINHITGSDESAGISNINETPLSNNVNFSKNLMNNGESTTVTSANLKSI